jgi:hypothetical protein
LTPTFFFSEDLLGQALQPQNLEAAWKRVRANKGTAGIDGMTIDDFPTWARSGEWKVIVQELEIGQYLMVGVLLVFFFRGFLMVGVLLVYCFIFKKPSKIKDTDPIDMHVIKQSVLLGEVQVLLFSLLKIDRQKARPDPDIILNHRFCTMLLFHLKLSGTFWPHAHH